MNVKGGREEEKWMNMGVNIRPEEARFCESKFNSSQGSPRVKEKEGFGQLMNEYDLTQKKPSAYFPTIQ